MLEGNENIMLDGRIKDLNELEFSIFCIENVAIKLDVNAKEIYDAYTKKSDILYGYIVPMYEVLHTQGKEYIVDDLLDVMEEKSVKL